MLMDEEKKRFPAVYRTIAGIKGDEGRVRILCSVVSSSGTEATVDDGTGQMRVAFSDPEAARKAAEWKTIRVLGRPANGSLNAEIVQDMRKLNICLYRKIMGE
jgi:hypothetical protein